jgi:hypothetical protein
MNATTPKRPPMLSATCFYLGLFAVVQAISAMDLVGSWNGNNASDRVSGALSALRDAGLSQASAESSYKGFITVLAVLAAAGVVFAVYTARGDRASRVGLTVTSVVVGVCFFFGATGGSFMDTLLGALSVAFTTRLWRGDARNWFRVLAGKEPIEPKRRPTPPTPAPPTHAPAAQPLPPAGPVQVALPHAPASSRLPKPVSIAVWTTLIGSGVAALGSGLVLLVLALVGNDYEQIVRDSPLANSMLGDSTIDFDQMYRTSMAIFGVTFALSLGGLVAATRILVTKKSGDVLLFVMASVTVVMSILTAPLGLPFTAAAIVVLIQLRKPESRQWFVKT